MRLIKEINFKRINEPKYLLLLENLMKVNFTHYESILFKCLEKHRFMFNVYPQHLQTKKTVNWCIEKEPTVFQNLNKKLITKDHLKKILVKFSGTCYLQWIPEKMITKEIIILSLKSSFFNFRYIPEKFNSKELILQFVEDDFKNNKVKACKISNLEMKACFDFFKDIDFINKCCKANPKFLSIHPNPTVETELRLIDYDRSFYKLVRLVANAKNLSYPQVNESLMKKRFILNHL